jgi:hypothetical protein
MESRALNRVVGAAQKRALIALANSEGGIGEVPYMMAPGLKNRGYVIFIGRADFRSTSAYICQITDYGRMMLREDAAE